MSESISVKFLEFYIQGYFTTDNEPDGTENTFLKKQATEINFFLMYCGLHLISSCLLSLVKYPVHTRLFIVEFARKCNVMQHNIQFKTAPRFDGIIV
jgi:hypothetical protein